MSAPKHRAPKARTPDAWCALLGWHILDPDGWRADDKPWDEPLTRVDFEARAAVSTARHDPPDPMLVTAEGAC